jgi:hypothetical protein
MFANIWKMETVQMKSNKRPNGKGKPYLGKSGLQKHLINCNSG